MIKCRHKPQPNSLTFFGYFEQLWKVSDECSCFIAKDLKAKVTLNELFKLQY